MAEALGKATDKRALHIRSRFAMGGGFPEPVNEGCALSASPDRQSLQESDFIAAGRASASLRDRLRPERPSSAVPDAWAAALP